MQRDRQLGGRRCVALRCPRPSQPSAPSRTTYYLLTDDDNDGDSITEQRTEDMLSWRCCGCTAEPAAQRQPQGPGPSRPRS